MPVARAFIKTLKPEKIYANKYADTSPEAAGPAPP